MEPPALFLPRGQCDLHGHLEASVPGSELQALLGCGAVPGLQSPEGLPFGSHSSLMAASWALGPHSPVNKEATPGITSWGMPGAQAWYPGLLKHHPLTPTTHGPGSEFWTLAVQGFGGNFVVFIEEGSREHRSHETLKERDF